MPIIGLFSVGPVVDLTKMVTVTFGKGESLASRVYIYARATSIVQPHVYQPAVGFRCCETIDDT